MPTPLYKSRIYKSVLTNVTLKADEQTCHLLPKLSIFYVVFVFDVGKHLLHDVLIDFFLLFFFFMGIEYAVLVLGFFANQMIKVNFSTWIQLLHFLK